MPLGTKLTADLVSIAKAGGGLDFEAGQKLTSDLVSIVKAAAGSGATVCMRGVSTKLTSDLVTIAKAGGGRVIFCD